MYFFVKKPILHSKVGQNSPGWLAHVVPFLRFFLGIYAFQLVLITLVFFITFEWPICITLGC